MLLKAGLVILLLFGGVWYYSSIYTSKNVLPRLFQIGPSSLDARIWRWNESLRIILDHPFGIGISGIYGTTWFAHNIALFILLSFGFIGFIGFFWIFVRHTKACWSGLHSQSINLQILSIGGIGCTTVLFVGGIFSNIYWDPWQVLTVWIPVGITMAAVTLKGRDKGWETNVSIYHRDKKLR